MTTASASSSRSASALTRSHQRAANTLPFQKAGHHHATGQIVRNNAQFKQSESSSSKVSIGLHPGNLMLREYCFPLSY